MRRFRGTLAAALVLLVLGGLWLATRPSPPEAEVPEALLRFEKEDLVRFSLTRPDLQLEVVQRDGTWEVAGETWRPSRSMIRRVAHQLHDLDARALVDPDADDLARYGLGDGAVRVELGLADGRTVAFEAGDPNPTSVSWYLRPLPGRAVYVVKKAAIDYFRLDAAAFREHRIAAFDTPDAVGLTATVDGRTLGFRRTGERSWQMTEPVGQPASRDAVRRALGRVSALRAEAFVADQPADRTPWSLDPPLHTVEVRRSGASPIALEVGAVVPDTDPPQRWVRHVGDDAVYAVRDGFLEALQLPLEDYRDRELVGLHEWDLATMSVTRGADAVTLTRTADGWRWPDGEAVDGSTPRRVAERAVTLRVERFLDDGSDLGEPWATLVLDVEGSDAVTVELGDDGTVARVGERGPHQVPGDLAAVVEDLFRELGRKRDRDHEKGLDLDETDPGD